MEPDEAPFPSGWTFGDLRGLREPSASTYRSYSLASLPPLPAHLFDGSYGWLPPLPEAFVTNEHEAECRPTEMEAYRRSAREYLAGLQESARVVGVSLPPAFLSFIGDVDRVFCLRSRTDCFFTVPKRVVASAGADAGYFVKFFSDSQDCCHWNLWIPPDGSDHCVVKTENDPEGYPSPGQTQFESPDFESFIYRTWVENEIWFRLACNEPLEPLQEEYADHYRRQANPERVTD